MGIIKKSKGGALEALRRQKEIARKVNSGEARNSRREALVLLLDMSPSMTAHENAATMSLQARFGRGVQPGQRAWDAAVRATRALVRVSTVSKVGVVTFCRIAPPPRRLDVGADIQTILNFLARFDPNQGEGTDFTNAINAGLDLLEPHAGMEVRRMILMTDGCDGRHSGATAALQAEERLRSSGVILDTVGFGDVDASELRRLADLGKGTYHHSINGAALVKTFKRLEAGVRGLLGSG